MTKIKDMPAGEMPREKGIRYGVRNLSSRELLALILRSGTKGQSVLETADALLAAADGISGLAGLDFRQLKEIRGISDAKALEILACLEISRRILLEDVTDQCVFNSPETVRSWLMREIGYAIQEKFIVLYLDVHGKLIRWRELFCGTLSESNVYPRDIIREGLLCSCSAMILVHNHPGGIPLPSEADIRFTGEIKKIAAQMGMRVEDHLIVTGNSCFSFAAEGLMEDCMEDGVKEW